MQGEAPPVKYWGRLVPRMWFAEAFFSDLRPFVQLLALDGRSFSPQFWQMKNARPFVFSEWHQQKPTKASKKLSLQLHRAKQGCGVLWVNR